MVVTDVNTCTATTSATVTVNPLPIPAINPASTAICIGNSTTLTASGGTSYAWDNGDNTAATTVSPVTLSTYNVVVTDGNSCTATTSATVTVNPLPIPVINPNPAAVCIGYSITLTAGGGTSYAWNNGDNTVTTTVTPAVNTTYSVVVTDANSCSATVSTTVTVNPVPTATISPTTARICRGQLVTLTAAGAQSYTWSNSDGSASTIVSPPATILYTVTVTDANQCSGTASINVQVIQPMVLATQHADATCYGLSDGLIDLTVSSGLAPYGFLWSNSGITEDLTGLGVGTYSVVVTDAAGCTASTVDSIKAPQALVLTTSFVDPTCVSLPNDGSITLSAAGGTTPYSYLWSNGSIAGNQLNIGPGIYTVSVTDGKGCITDTSFTLRYIYDFTIQATPSVTLDLAETAILTYTTTGTTGNLSSVWSPSYNVSCTNCPAPVASPNHTTSYQIKVTNDAGCTALDTTIIYVMPSYALYIPNAFTPNGDGKNDYFEIFGNKKSFKFVEVSVFNRWGEAVFKSNDIDFAWDGTYKGALLEPASYVWQLNVTFIDGHSPLVQTGSLTLLK